MSERARQDVFGEGSFIGKGIYDVDAFEAALGERFPDNRILSHDLLEGCYARAGLLSDGLLYEDYPARYAVDVTRRYRWIRGDWQLARLAAAPCRACATTAPGRTGSPTPCRPCPSGSSWTTSGAASCPRPCWPCWCSAGPLNRPGLWAGLLVGILILPACAPCCWIC